MAMNPEPIHAGDPQHPDHAAWLCALGAATYEATRLSGIAIDLLRIHYGASFFDLVDLTLGQLIERLDAEAKGSRPIPGLAAFVAELRAARTERNDLMHALPVLHGLHRRTKADLARVVNFYSIDDLKRVRKHFYSVTVHGNQLLYFDRGAAVRAYADTSG
jgi:hypothetical protein